ncbi:hypothetical protein BROUX41_002149 [Berkeleyomyces rouxiae]|uniref:uncharacterized protein n=1 Tax=Berkeleyomyces rouxiae TaxID=2035830 RepID=UPI003B78BF37
MATAKSLLQAQTWKKDDFFISTNPALFPLSTLAEVFDSSDFYWAKALPLQDMKEMLENSLSFGLYEQREPNDPSQHPPAPKFIGLARCVTDFVTFCYLTDVWVDPSYQGRGLGGWLVSCVKKVLDGMPHLRRSMLFTASWEKSVPFYEKLMDMTLIESRKGEGLAIMESKGKGHPSYGCEGNGYN